MVIGLLAAFLPFTSRCRRHCSRSGGVDLVFVVTRSRRTVANLVQPLSGMAVALFAGTAYRYFVEGAEKRKVKGCSADTCRRTSTRS